MKTIITTSITILLFQFCFGQNDSSITSKSTSCYIDITNAILKYLNDSSVKYIDFYISKNNFIEADSLYSSLPGYKISSFMLSSFCNGTDWGCISESNQINQCIKKRITKGCFRDVWIEKIKISNSEGNIFIIPRIKIHLTDL
jgi:hypothetical protein